jgi:CO/xanthine dehydrogenase Mo-binding subunit
MSRFRYIGEKVIRKDGRLKATGELQYMADMQMKGMLYGVLVHPAYAHATISELDISEAMQYPGVVSVITAADVPGLNRHGLMLKDQPVLCEKTVRYLGDTLAVVVAHSLESAHEAAMRVKVTYTRLPEVNTAAEALQENAPVIHEGGNLAAHYSYAGGNVNEAFENAAVIVKKTFNTQYHEHAYLETEGGIARPLPNGGVEIWVGCQNGNRAARDISLILGVPEEHVILHSDPMGGGFGGKDDLTLQGILALCAVVTQKPVQIDFTREESFLVSPKRMPMEIRMKMAAAADGTLLANEVQIIGTCGAYACYAPAILSLAVEHACGMYYFPNVDVTADLAYTNNWLVSAFRGFGNVQMNFAVESMMDMLAEKVNMNPIDFRRKNVLRSCEKNSYGYQMCDSNHTDEILKRIEDTKLWENRDTFRKAADKPWLKRGIGFAACFQGVGLGNHCIPDSSTARVELHADGTFSVCFGNEDMGQGSTTSLLIIAAEVLQISPDKLTVVCGISGKTPDTGPTTASKTTYITGWAVCRAAENLLNEAASVLDCRREELVLKDEQVNGLTWKEIYGRLSEEARRQEGFAEFQNVEEKYNFGVHYIYTYLSQIVGIEVNTLTGEIQVIHTEILPAAGKVINRLGYEGQCEGGALMSLGYALYENFVSRTGGATKNDLYPIEDREKTGPFGANGVGEVVSVTGTAAILNAVYDAIGLRITDLPCNMEKILLRSGR